MGKLSSDLKIRAIGFGDFITPSTRYRLLQFIPFLKEKNASIEFRSSFQLKKWSDFSSYVFRSKCESKEVIWIQKKLFPIFWIYLTSKRYPIVFDFDDAIWTSERKDRSKFTRWRVKLKLNFILRKSSLVIVGNKFLADYASRYSSNVIVIPTVLDLSLYSRKVHENTNPVTLGWIGQSVNFKFLDGLDEVFHELNKFMNFNLLVVADKDFYSKNANVVNKRWSSDLEVSYILEMDIGLMPLEDSEWSRGKCAFKAIQYMAAGVPAVASSVGVNLELISHRKNSYLAFDMQDWIESIKELAESFELRNEIGKSSRASIEDRYSLNVASARLYDLFINLHKL